MSLLICHLWGSKLLFLSIPAELASTVIRSAMEKHGLRGSPSLTDRSEFMRFIVHAVGGMQAFVPVSVVSVKTMNSSC